MSHFIRFETTNWMTAGVLMALTFCLPPDLNESHAGSAVAKRAPAGKAAAVVTVPNAIIPKEYETLKGHDREVNSLAFHPNGNSIVSGGHEGAYITWDVSVLRTNKKGARIRPVERKNNSDHVVAVAFDTTGSVFACSGVTHWGNGLGTNLAIYTPYRPNPFGIGCDCAWSWTCVAIEPQGRFLSTGSLNREFKVVALTPPSGQDGRLVSKNALIVPNEVWRTHWHPTEPLVAAGGRDGWIRLYQVRHDGIEETQQQFAGHGQGGTSGLKFAPDGQRLVSVGHDKNLKVWNAWTGTQIQSFKPADAVPQWCELHPVFSWAAICYDDGKTLIVNYDTGHVVATLVGHAKSVSAAAFHPDGNWLVTAGKDFTIKVWDLGIPSIWSKKGPRHTGKKVAAM